ncbi:hypothetical protein [Clostridium sp. UBA1056]|jgi:hypothetical protein|uniref:hypothetical protein n=1 Tax=unclassified Clostridium TaxID=2614128 RepID=UPI003217D963
MYVLFGDNVIHNDEMKEIIESKSDFKVIKDMTKGTKREDVHAFCLSVPVSTLNEIIEEEYEDFNLSEMEEDDLFDEYLSLAEEMALDMEEFIPEEAIIDAKAYKWDQSDNDIKVIVIIGNDEVEERKLRDLMKRLLTQAE